MGEVGARGVGAVDGERAGGCSAQSVSEVGSMDWEHDAGK